MFRYINQQRQIIRSYYTGIAKTAVIYPAAFMVATGMGQFGLGLVFYVREVFQLPPDRVGLLAAVWSITYVFGCLVLRPAFDHILPRFLIISSTLALSVCAFAIQAAPRVWVIFLLYGLYGLSLSLFWPPLMGWLMLEMEGRELSRVVSRFNLSWCLGAVLAPFMCGWLSERSVRWPLLASSGLFLLTATLITGAAAALPLVRADRSTGGNGENEEMVGSEGTPLRFPAWAGLVATYFGMGIALAILPMYARDELGFSKSTVGTLLLIRGLFNAAAFLLLGRLVFWHFRALPMILGQVAGALVFVLFARARTEWSMGILLAAFGMSMAFSYANSIFHGASESRNRSARMAIHESLLAAGLVGGSVIGGKVYQAAGMVSVFRLTAGVYAALALVQTVLCRLFATKNRGPEQIPEAPPPKDPGE